MRYYYVWPIFSKSLLHDCRLRLLGVKSYEICDNIRLQNTASVFLKFKFNFEWLFQNFAKASREKVLLQRLLPSWRPSPSPSFLTPLLLCCHPVFQISQCQCNRGSVAVSCLHAFVSQEIVIIIIIVIRKVPRLDVSYP